MTRTLVLMLVVLASWATPSQAVAQHTDKYQTAATDQIKLALKPSREQAASDTSYAINAEIENTSADAIFFTPTSLTLTVPPEIDPWPYKNEEEKQYESEWAAFIPATDFLRAAGERGLNKVAGLQPGSRMRVVFKLPRNPGWWRRLEDAVRFVPGNYTIGVVCNYWTSSRDAEQGTRNYSTQIAEITLPMVAPQSAILCGAALGGFMAFALLPTLWLPVTKKFHQHGPLGKIFVIVRGLGVSSLLSVMVTILLSRVSESQFLVRVSVQDFWGAVAIGFIVGASGTGVLQRFSLAQAQKLEPTQPEKSTTVTENASRVAGADEAAQKTGSDSKTSAAHAA